MPLYPVPDRAPRGIGAPIPDPVPSPGFSDVIGDALATESPVVAPFYSEAPERAQRISETYSAFDEPLPDVAGSVVNRLVYSQSPEETQAILREAKRYQAAQERIASAGWQGFMANLAAGMVDPTIALPGGAIVRGARGGVSIARTAAAAAALNTGGAAITEGVLGAVQPARTREEQLAGVASAAVLAGALGGAVGAFARRSARRAAGYEVAPEIDAANVAAIARIEEQHIAASVAAGADRAAARIEAAPVAEFYSALAASTGRSVADLARVLPVEEVAPVRAPETAPRIEANDVATFAAETGARFEEMLQRASARQDAPPELRTAYEQIQAAKALETRQQITADDVVEAPAERPPQAAQTPQDAVAEPAPQPPRPVFERALTAPVESLPEDVRPIMRAYRNYAAATARRAEAAGSQIASPVREAVQRVETADLQAAWKAETTRMAREWTGDSTAGAASRDTLSEAALRDMAGGKAPRDFNAVRTRSAEFIVKSNRLIGDPVAALMTSPSVAARRIVRGLVETPVMTEGQAAGFADAGLSVETAIKGWQGNLAAGMKMVETEFLASRGITAGTSDARRELQVVGRQARDRVGGVETGTFTWTQFKTEVATAMRNGDQHANPYVAKAAKAMRENVYAPLRDEAIARGLLPEDVAGAAEADQYLNRIYAVDRIVKERPRFVRMATDWLMGEQAKKATIQEDVARLDDERRIAETELKKAQRRAETATKRVRDVEQRIAEQAIAERRNLSREERLQARVDAIDAEIQDIRDQLSDMRDQRFEDRERIDAMEAEVRALEQAKRQASASDTELRRDAKSADAAGETPADPMDYIRSDSTLIQAFKIVSGQQQAPKVRTIVDDLREIGVKDDGGEMAAAGITARSHPTLVRKDGLQLEDRLGERLAELGYTGDLSRDGIIDMVRRTLNGEPVVSPKADPQAITVNEFVAVISEAGARLGADLANSEDFRRLLAGWESGRGRVTLEDLDRELADMQAAGADPVEPVEGMADALRARREALDGLRATIAKAVEAKRQRGATRRVERARSSERSMEAKAQRSRGEILADRLTRAEDHAATMDAMVARREADVGSARERLEDAVLRWEGHSTDEAKTAVKARMKAEDARAQRLEAEGRDPAEAPRMRAADKAIDRAVKRILGAPTDLERQEMEDIANQIADRIISTPDGRLPYDQMEGKGGQGFTPQNTPGGLRGPMKARVWAIPDDYRAADGTRFSDFLESDIEMAAHAYVRTMAPDVEIAAKFGAPEPGSDRWLESQIREIEIEYDRKMAEAPEGSAQKTLQDQKDRDIRALAGIRDRLRHTYAVRANPTSWMLRAQDVVLMWNMMRLLGGMTISAFPDAFRVVMQNGFSRAGLAQPLMAMAGDARKMAKAELQAGGTALDIMMSSRIMSIADFDLHYHRLSKFERGVQGAAAVFGKMSLMNYWNQAMKEWSGMVTLARMTPAIRDLAAGKQIMPSDRAKLAQMGIDGPMADRMAREMKAHGKDVDGVFMPNTMDWTDQEAARHLRGALAAEVDRIIVTPGQERPLWMSRDGWRMVGQFRSFMLSAQVRVLASALQQRDRYVVMGLIGMVGMGALAYAIKQKLRGQEVTDNPAQLMAEALDQSGVSGWLFDVNNIMEKVTQGRIGLSQLTGEQISRFASRNAVGAVLGPSLGTATDALDVIRAITHPEDFSASDLHRIRKLLPAQNLFYFRNLLNAIEGGASDSLGLPDRRAA